MSELDRKRVVVGVVGIAFLIAMVTVGLVERDQRYKPHEAQALGHVTAESRACVECHSKQSPNIVNHWRDSTHFEKGVGCFECHKAESKDPDAFTHYAGPSIATIVSPKDCSACHAEEYRQFRDSHHAAGGEILASLDNLLGEVIEGSQQHGNAAAVSGCKQCHGSVIKVVKADAGKAAGPPWYAEGVEPMAQPIPIRLDPETWPNTGIGRYNPDGSKGSCTACHSRHRFESGYARHPDNCGRCHMGPDHPQREIYEESKHGIAFANNLERMNLNNASWVLGVDYTAAPTCTTCHMAATPSQKSSHDVGGRISWTLRPKVSNLLAPLVEVKRTVAGREELETVELKPGDTVPEVGGTLKYERKVYTYGSGDATKDEKPEQREGAVVAVKTWENRRDSMKNVCYQCHTSQWVNNFYVQYDNNTNLYNEKFGKPATKIMDRLYEGGHLTKGIEFDEHLEWVYFELWHHEGRRARMGAAMMGPDYTQWHGNYEVAKHYYDEFLPEAVELAHGDRKVLDLIAQEMAKPHNQWRSRGNPEMLSAIREHSQARYGQ